MSHTLNVGLSDLSKELGETTVNSTDPRIRAYNDAAIDFFNEKKWPFGVKENAALSTSIGDNSYSLSSITDMRFPGPIKEIYLGSDTTPYIPIDWEDRNNADVQDGKFFYLTPDESDNNIHFLGDITAVQVMHIWYYFIPTRIEDIDSVSTFPIPDRYRKTVATLAAAYVQWSRYLDSQGNRLFNVYERMVGRATNNQAERNRRQPRKLVHFLKNIGFKRTYP